MSSRSRRRSVELPRLETGLGSVDRFAVRTPSTHATAFETLDLLRRQRAVAARADVQQQVAALARRLAQRVHDLRRRLVRGVAPGRIPTTSSSSCTSPTVPRAPSPGSTARVSCSRPSGEAVVDEDVRLQLADHRRELGRSPLIGCALPLSVEPDHVDLAVVREQLADLSEQRVEVGVPGVATGGRGTSGTACPLRGTPGSPGGASRTASE